MNRSLKLWFFVAAAALLSLAPAALALDVLEFARYFVFDEQPVGAAGDFRVAVGNDGRVLMVWSGYRVKQQRETVEVQWFSDLGEPENALRVSKAGSGLEVAAGSAGEGMVLWASKPPNTKYKITALSAAGRGKTIDLRPQGCDFPGILVSAQIGYFFTCFDPRIDGFRGRWLEYDGTPSIRTVDLGMLSEQAAAGGHEREIAFLSRTEDEASFQWLLPKEQGPVLSLGKSDFSFSESGFAAAHVGAPGFVVVWAPSDESGTFGGDDVPITHIRSTRFKPPAGATPTRVVSQPSGTAADPHGRHERLGVYAVSAKRQIAVWSTCAWTDSPAGATCVPEDGLYLRALTDGKPKGPVLELPSIPAGARAVYTGKSLLVFLLYETAENAWSLEVRAFELTL